MGPVRTCIGAGNKIKAYRRIVREEADYKAKTSH